MDDATCDEQTLRGWWKRWPGANVAVRTDHRPRLDVDLLEAAEALQRDPTLPHQTEVVVTPSGGLHVAFAVAEPVASKALQLEDGRALGDLKAARAYVLVPPSSIGAHVYRAVSPSEVGAMAVADPLGWIETVLLEFGYRLSTNGAGADSRRGYEALGEVIVKGQRHNTLTSYAGRVWVEGLSGETLTALLTVVNERQCSPPLPDDEVRRVAEHFISNRQPGRLRLNGVAGVEADVGEAVATAEYQFVPATNNEFVAKYIRWRASTNDAPLEYAEAQAIASLAAIAGPRLRIPVREKPRPVACNLNVVLVGPSTLSRKSDVQNHTQVQLQDLIPDTIIDAPGSAEGFVQDLARHQDAGAVLFVDELAWWFAAIKRKTYLSEMKGYIMRAYDGSTISRRNRSKKSKDRDGSVTVSEDLDRAQEPCLTILGTSTPDRLAQVSTMEDIDDGWWPRFVIVWPQGRPPMRPMGPPDDSLTALRVEVERDLATMNKRLGSGVQALPNDHAWEAANEAFRRMEHAVEEDPEFGPFISRMELRLLKVAALLALAEDRDGKGNVIVDEQHILQAEVLCDRWLESAKRFSRHVGQNEFEYSLNRAWAALTRNGGKAARRDVARAAHVPARVMDEIERTLEDRGMIEIIEQPTQGRTKKEWIAVHQ